MQEAQELAEMHARTGDGNRKLDSALYRRSGEVAWWLGNANAIETRFGPTRDDESEPPIIRGGDKAMIHDPIKR